MSLFRELRVRRIWLLPLFVLLVSLLFTFWVSYRFSAATQAKNLSHFRNATMQLENVLYDRVNNFVALLRGGAGLFAARENTTREEFNLFIDRLRLPVSYPGVEGIGFVRKTLRRDTDALTTEMQRQGVLDFKIWPAGERPVYFPIIYRQPLEPRNARAIGFDMFTEPVRRAAMEFAATNGICGSGKVRFIQETDPLNRPGFIIYVGVYRDGQYPDTVAERQEKLMGFVYCPFRLEEFLTMVFGSARTQPLHVEVYDGEKVASEHLLFRSAKPPSPQPLFAETRALLVARRPWTIEVKTTLDFERTLESGVGGWVLAIGSFLSAALFGLTLFLVKQHELVVRSEKALRASEELHRTVTQTASDGIITINERSIILSVNPAVRRIFGYTRSELPGQSLTVLMPERLREPYRAAFQQFLFTGEKSISWEGIELPGLHRDGREIPLEITISIFVQDGKTFFTGIIRDISARKKIEEQTQNLNRELERRVQERTAELQEINSQMEAFIYSIAHDLRAPLRSMQGFAGMLLEDYAGKLGPEAQDYAGRIVRSSQFMDNLIQDLLAYSQIRRSKLELAPISLESSIGEACAQCEKEIRTTNATISIEASLSSVIAHAPTLRQVLINLLSNAAKFVAPGVPPQIVVRAEKVGKNCRVWIEDNGIGIAPEYHERIFGVFERLDKKKYAGTGIGLAIVRCGVERMGGKVGLESEVGKGCRFWFELPAA